MANFDESYPSTISSVSTAIFNAGVYGEMGFKRFLLGNH